MIIKINRDPGFAAFVDMSGCELMKFEKESRKATIFPRSLNIQIWISRILIFDEDARVSCLRKS